MPNLICLSSGGRMYFLQEGTTTLHMSGSPRDTLTSTLFVVTASAPCACPVAYPPCNTELSDCNTARHNVENAMSLRSVRNAIATVAIVSLTAGTVLAPTMAYAKGGGGG